MTGLRTGVHYFPDRIVSPQVAGEFAAGLEATGVVDFFQTWDQLVSFFPRALWRPDVTPLAAIAPDCDSFHDAFILSSFAAAATSRLGITLTHDAIRKGPAEMLQSLLTIGSLTSAPVAIQMGAGELKQTRPYGYKRSQGIGRLEDQFAIIRHLIESPGLVSYEGNHTTFQDAWIGGIKPNPPQVWALGGGPRLISTAARLADGIVSLAPNVFPTPERFAAMVDSVKSQVADAGRDPSTFTFGLWPVVIVHDDDELFERIVNNPLTQWLAAIFGRLNQSDWSAESIKPAMPPDWHYAMRLLPQSISRAEVESILAATPRALVERSFIHGTAQEVAQQLQPYVEAGANFLAPLDFSAACLTIEEQPAALERVIEVCRQLKVH